MTAPEEALEEPREYIGTNYWIRLAYVPGQPVRHVYQCPICHGAFDCEMGCSLEPDLERDDGTPTGAYHCCSKACAKEISLLLGLLVRRPHRGGVR